MVQAQDLCSMSLPLVCVTGGSGFVANHVCKQLVDSGLYRVRATVRSKSPAKTGLSDHERHNYRRSQQLTDNLRTCRVSGIDWGGNCGRLRPIG